MPARRIDRRFPDLMLTIRCHSGNELEQNYVISNIIGDDILFDILTLSLLFNEMPGLQHALSWASVLSGSMKIVQSGANVCMCSQLAGETTMIDAVYEGW